MNLEEAMVGLSDEEQAFIKTNYSYPHRKYHNLTHLEDMLRWVPESVGSEMDRAALVDSILYHDIVYSKEPVSPGLNESLSIMTYFMVGVYCSHCPDTRPPVAAWEARLDYNAAVTHCINATAYHHIDQPYLTGLGQLMVDLDLQSFAQPREEFLEGSQAVMDEFTSYCTPTDFLKGNRKFLEMLLARRKLYYVRTDWETPARENIAFRIAQITEILDG